MLVCGTTKGVPQYMDEIKTGYGVTIDPDFIIEIDGKNFIRYPGALNAAHETARKLNGSLIQTSLDLLQIPDDSNNNTAIVKVMFAIKDGDVTLLEGGGLGDANPSNTNRMVSRHLIRMAETRANARAFRVLADIQMTALEELGDFDEAVDDQSSSKKRSAKKEPKAEVDNELITLQNDLKALYNDSKLSKDEFKGILNDTLKIKAKSVDDMSKKDIQKAIEYFKSQSANPPQEAQQESTNNPDSDLSSADRGELIQEITRLRGEYKGVTSSVLKAEAANIKGVTDKPVGANDLSDDELRKLITVLKEKYQ